MQNDKFDQNQSDLDEQERKRDEKQEITSDYEQPNPMIADEDKKEKDLQRKKEEEKNIRDNKDNEPKP